MGKRDQQQNLFRNPLHAILATTTLIIFPNLLFAQESAISQLPDAPSFAVQQKQDSGTEELASNVISQSKGKLPGSSPNSGPMNVSEKFAFTMKPAFGPRTLLTATVAGGFRMTSSPHNYPHEWRAGAAAYGRNVGDIFATRAAYDFGRFLPAAAFHEDLLYHRSTSTNFFARTSHAIAFTLVDQTDTGHRTLAISNLAGAASGGFIRTAYLPDGWNDIVHAGQRSAFLLSGAAGQNLMQEFAPELYALKKHLHIPKIPMPPAWW